MAAKTRIPEPVPPADDDGPVDFICGLRRVGPSLYTLVSGRIVNGTPELKVDTISQSLDHAAEQLRAEFQRLMETIP